MMTHEELAAYRELDFAKAKYCRALDTQDWTALSALLIDAVEFGMCSADSESDMIVGRTAVIENLRQLTAGARTVHQVHNPEMEVIGDEAQVIWAVQDRAVYDNGFSVTGYGHYFERWVKEKGEWRAASVLLRHTIIDTTR